MTTPALLCRIFVDWFVHFPLLLGITALLVWIVVFDGLKGMGLPDVFWRYKRYASALGGMAVAVVFSIACFVGFLLDVEWLASHGVTLFRYSFWIEVLFAVLVLLGFIRNRREEGTFGAALTIAYFVTQAALGVFARWLADFAHSQRVRAFWRGHSSLHLALIPQATDLTIGWHTYALVIAVIAIVVYVLFATVVYRRVVSSLAIGILLALVLLVYGWETQNYTRSKVILLYAFIAVLLLSNIAVKRRYRYPELRSLYDRPPRSLASSQATNLIPVVTSLDEWRKQASGSQPPKLLIVATSGGGIRAAAWTSAVLTNLSEKLGDRFHQHVRLVTGASGGMVGAGDWVARLCGGETFHTGGATAIAQNALDHVARALALRDVTKLLLPVTWNDRGVALEDRWRELSPPMTTTFAALAECERKGSLPSLIFSPMFVEDGRRLLISNLDLTSLTEAVGPPIPPAPLYSVRAVQMFALFPEAQERMSVATAARMNASFPYVAPAAELPTTPRRHIVDAGYYDNFGISTATAFISQYEAWLRQNTSGVAIIEIRDSSLQGSRCSPVSPKDGPMVNAFGELTAPLIGAISSALTVQGYHNDNDEQRVSERFGPDFFTRVLFEYSGDDAPLSWSLTDAERQDINVTAAKKVAEAAPELAAML